LKLIEKNRLFGNEIWTAGKGVSGYTRGYSDAINNIWISKEGIRICWGRRHPDAEKGHLNTLKAIRIRERGIRIHCNWNSKTMKNNNLNLIKPHLFEANLGRTIPNLTKDDLILIFRKIFKRGTWIFLKSQKHETDIAKGIRMLKEAFGYLKKVSECYKQASRCFDLPDSETTQTERHNW